MPVVHELSLALGLVETATAEAQRLGGVSVAAVHLRLGALSGVVAEALLFSFDVAAAGTAVEGARLVIEPEAVVAWCERCDCGRTLDDPALRRCPVCDEPTPRLLAGDGMELTALEIIEHVDPDR